MVIAPPEPGVRDDVGTSRRRLHLAQALVATVAGVAVVVATRNDPALSPDSITYLSAAEHLRGLDGFEDFTGEPLAHFPPVFPAMLAPGGRSLVWAAIVGALCAAASGALFIRLLWSRVRPTVAVVAALAFVLSGAVVRVGATVWSETPYLMLALATLTVLDRPDLGTNRAVAAGVLAGLAFLTRYAGAALAVTGLVVVLAATWPRGSATALRRCLAYGAAPAAFAIVWMARNLAATGEPLGPHFEGGAAESFLALVRSLGTAIGKLVIDTDEAGGLTRPVGYGVLIGLVVASVVVAARRPRRLLDVGMAMFAITSIVVPVASRAIAGTHLEFRIMSPVLVPAVYFAAVLLDRLAHRRLVLGAGLAVALALAVGGVNEVITFPDRVDRSAGSPDQFSRRLYGIVAALPDDATVLTNNPQRVWWNTGRVPTWFAFTVPQPGNSHFPLSIAESVERACSGETYLAWFPGLRNAGGRDPWEVRPDLADHTVLVEIESVPGGTLYRVEPEAPERC